MNFKTIQMSAREFVAVVAWSGRQFKFCFNPNVLCRHDSVDLHQIVDR